MISCNKVAALLMNDGLATASRWTRLQVRLHLAMCKLCSRLAGQIEAMRAAVRQMGDADKGLEQRLIRKLSGSRD